MIQSSPSPQSPSPQPPRPPARPRGIIYSVTQFCRRAFNGLVHTAWPHYLFIAGIVLKGLDGALELVGGVVLLLASRSDVNFLLAWFTQGELAEDPGDPVAHAILRFGRHLTHDTKLFIAFYLLAHGLLKVFLAIALLKRKHWAYPVALVIMSLLILIQFYRLSNHPSLWLATLTMVDILILVLVWLEYRRVKGSWMRTA